MKPEPVDIICLAAWFIVPFTLWVWWIRMRLGLDKRWFVIPAAPFISRGFYFALLPTMLGFVIGVVGMLLVVLNPHSNGALYLFFITFGLLGTSFIFAYLEPDWISPAWYRWLKKEHGDIMPYLVRDAHRLGRKVWLERVKTQEGLEEWANEVRRKYTRGGLR